MFSGGRERVHWEQFIKTPEALTQRHPANIYLFKINNRNTRKKCIIYLNSTTKTTKRRY